MNVYQTIIDRSSERVKASGEVFTPIELVREICDKLPPECWTSPDKKWLDPTCGNGQFLVEVKKRLMESLKPFILGDKEREFHILDTMIYGVDIMPDNVRECRARLGLSLYGNDGNIVCADGLLYDYEFVKTETGYLLNY